MRALTQFALDNRMACLLAVLVIMLAGPVSFQSHPSREDPAITIRSAVVTAQFPGMSPERIENLITKKLEEKVREMPEVDSIVSISSTGNTTIKIELHDRYFNIAPIWQDLRNKMKDVAGDLPDGTLGPFVNDDYGNVAMATIAITAEGFSLAEMRTTARALRDRLYSVKGVSKIELFGVEPERIFVEFSNARLAQLGLSPQSLVDTLQQQNIVLPGGKVEAGKVSFSIEPTGNFEAVSEIGAVPIELPNDTGQVVYLRDFATISRSYVDPPKAPAFFNGKPAIVLGVSMVDQFDALAFGEAMGKRITELENTLPIGFTLSLATFQPADISNALNGVMSNLYQTIAIVLVVVMVFLGWRLGLIVGIMVPLTMLLSILVMRYMGIELERMSLASLIIGLGLLVDNGIVVAEEISIRLSIGMDRREAVISTGQDLALPLLSSSLTTILAFMPLMLAENTAGEYTRSLSLVIAIALLGSWLLAMTITPLCCYWFAKTPEPIDEKTAYSSRFFDTYRSILTTVLGHRLISLGVVLASLVGGLWLFQFVPKIFFPASERAQFQVYLDLQVGVNTHATLESTARFNKWINDRKLNPEVTSTVSYVASGGPRFFLSLNPNDPDPHRVFVLVNTTGPEANGVLINRVRQHLLAQFPEVRGEVKPLSMGPGEAGLLQFRIYGPETGKLAELNEALQSAIREIPGTRDLKDDWENRTIKVMVKVDQARARRVGLSSQTIAQALNAALSGTAVTDYREGDTAIPVVLRAVEEDRANLDRIRTLSIMSTSGEAIPLLQVADFSGEPQFSQIRRRNLERAITVSVKHASMTATEFYAVLKPAVDKIVLPADYRIEPAGEIKDSGEAQSALFANMPLALALILFILVLQFKGYRKPAIILSVIPLTLIGVSISLLIAPGAVFGFMAMMGLLSLAGIIINNAIVLIDRIDTELERGATPADAIVEASVKRLRPILMTTLTTILGLAPIIVSGDVLFYDLAIVVAGGLAAGTLLTLGVVPVLFSLFYRVEHP